MGKRLRLEANAELPGRLGEVRRAVESLGVFGGLDLPKSLGREVFWGFLVGLRTG